MMTMMTVTLLMMSSVASLGHPAATKPTRERVEHKLKPIIDLVDRNISLPAGDFQNLRYLAEGIEKCEAKFFCKVHELMDKPQETKEIARHLKVYNDLKEFQCKDVRQQVQATGNKYPMLFLMKDLIGCIRYKIMHGPASITATPTNATQPSE